MGLAGSARRVAAIAILDDPLHGRGKARLYTGPPAGPLAPSGAPDHYTDDIWLPYGRVAVDGDRVFLSESREAPELVRLRLREGPGAPGQLPAAEDEQVAGDVEGVLDGRTIALRNWVTGAPLRTVTLPRRGTCKGRARLGRGRSRTFAIRTGSHGPAEAACHSRGARAGKGQIRGDALHSRHNRRPRRPPRQHPRHDHVAPMKPRGPAASLLDLSFPDVDRALRVRRRSASLLGARRRRKRCLRRRARLQEEQLAGDVWHTLVAVEECHDASAGEVLDRSGELVLGVLVEDDSKIIAPGAKGIARVIFDDAEDDVGADVCGDGERSRVVVEAVEPVHRGRDRACEQGAVRRIVGHGFAPST